MHHTIFDTPVVNTVMRWISVLMLRLLGWRVDGKAPDEAKYVLIAAPHTSNWDFPFTLMVCFALRLRVYWMGKSSLFPPVMGSVMRWLGGIPVDREKSGNLVQGTIDAFNRTERLTVIVPPEGTRDKVSHWKTGFYYIALGAKVPILLGFMDFKDKVGGVAHLFHPSGDIEHDMQEIKQFYRGFTGKNPQQFDDETIQIKAGSKDRES
ncbi:lysophospholipid acyltransferase family protein [Solimicrobium silvestre]|uniref:Acyltransferase n=1 Tax=Solimicrobium silvestre TaxID=2099400 RepID=A0A2S9H4N0_9BURK|nr:lysophospholipid acyltransferase family protein [Solimicrobium silvestre]PRC94944.1 Acyltransferase [Solimicrobium silvestre]